MRGLFLFVQFLDGFKNTQDNVSGKLVTLFEHAGFVERSEEHTSELQSLMRISYAVFCLKKKKKKKNKNTIKLILTKPIDNYTIKHVKLINLTQRKTIHTQSI